MEFAKKASPRYYHELGRGCDYLLRCKECRRLVTYKALEEKGCCPNCDNRRVIEITGLTLLEWLKIRLGFIDFGDRDKFLKEFSPWPRILSLFGLKSS